MGSAGFWGSASSTFEVDFFNARGRVAGVLPGWTSHRFRVEPFREVRDLRLRQRWVQSGATNVDEGSRYGDASLVSRWKADCFRLSSRRAFRHLRYQRRRWLTAPSHDRAL